MTLAVLRAHAEAVWNAALRAVQPERLVRERLALSADRSMLRAGDEPALRLDQVGRIVVVGGGKAAAGLASGVEAVLGEECLRRHDVSGLVSVPAGCGRRLERIEIRETRPMESNLPTPAVVRATHEMLDAVSRLGPHDLAIALVTGGGSALLAAPREGITLEEKIAVTRRLSESGADIATLNAARRTMSLVKAGGLARSCAAGTMLVLVISDVIGNDLDVVASGPCMPPVASSPPGCWTTPSGCRVRHVLLGDNRTAVAAAAEAARRAGYEIVTAADAGDERRRSAEDVGDDLAAAGLAVLEQAGRDGTPRAMLVGGEATVTVPANHGKGGRNQQTVLAAIEGVRRRAGTWPGGMLVASIGTDGEDGPTDAAGGVADAAVFGALITGGLDVAAALSRCDAYPVLAACGGLVRTGTTGTNVADLRILLARP